MKEYFTVNALRELKQLTKTAKQMQRITDEAIEKAIYELRRSCRSEQIFESAEEALLLYIYEGKDVNDKKIEIDDLMNIIKDALNQ